MNIFLLTFNIFNFYHFSFLVSVSKTLALDRLGGHDGIIKIIMNINKKGFSFIVPLIIITVFVFTGGAAYFYLQKGEKIEQKEMTKNETTEAAPENKPSRLETVKEPDISEVPAAAEKSLPVAPPVFEPESSQKFPTAVEITEFSNWASARGINLQAVNVSVDDMYYNRYDPAAHNITLKQIPGLMLAYEGLRKITGDALGTMRDKTIYFSTSNERPYANLTGDYGGTLKNTKSGFILTQPISEMGTIHELGHIVGYHGIEGLYGFAAPFVYLKGEYDALFDTTGIVYPPAQTPKGYISSYATANKAENFAEHFAYYVIDPGTFQKQMSGDELLVRKYNFFRDGGIFSLHTADKTPEQKCASNPSPTFTQDITDMSKVRYIVPPPTMGSGPSLKPHSYIGTDGQNVPVYVPAAVTLKSGSHYIGGPYTIEFQVSCEITMRFGHITNPVDAIKNLLPKEPQPGSQTQELSPISFAAGQLIGYTTGTPQAGNWDFGVYNSTVSNRYANDPDWNNSSVYTTAVCPFDYFAPSLKSIYQAKYDSYALGGNPPHGESFCQ